MEIVLAEDEANLRSALCHAFGREAWTVRDFPDGLAAWEYLESGPGAGERLLVLDIMMPRMDGLELCRRMRQIDSQLPILFLSSRDEEFDRVLGLELGADDYLCKPFSVRELVTRIKVLHRRAYGRRDSAPGESGPAMAAKGAMAGPVALMAGALVLDEASYRVWLQGREIHLTVSEFRILASLVAMPGVVKTREQLQLAAYPEDAYINERSVDCHIKRLRRKLAIDAGEGLIETVYGLGYRLVP